MSEDSRRDFVTIEEGVENISAGRIPMSEDSKRDFVTIEEGVENISAGRIL